MNRQPDVELVLRDYFADDGFTAPDHVLDVVEERIARQPRRLAWRLRGRPFMNAYAKIAVAAPTRATTIIMVCECWKITLVRVTMYKPAVTIVAAWINADTGVGPAIASGSHTCSGNCADLPQAPINKPNAIQESSPH